METVRKMVAAEAIYGGTQQVIDAALQDVGLTQNEIALYRSSLRLGPRPASTLAKSIRIQRTRVYDLLSSLESRGLIEMSERNFVRHYSATAPDKLISLVRGRKKQIEDQLESLERAIPSLFGDGQQIGTSIESKSLRGVRLVRETLSEILERVEGSLLAIGDIESVLRSHVGLTRWAQQFRDRRIARGVSLRIILQGPPDLVQEPSLLRETLSSPDVPHETLALATNESVLFIELAGSIHATKIDSKIFCLILNGLYDSWLRASRSWTKGV